jgi:L-gulonate 3-dehydrogenase
VERITGEFVKSQKVIETACIGCGVIGASWASAFARAGYGVRLFDPSPDAVSRAREAVDAAVATGDPADRQAMLARVSIAGSLEEAIRGADYVQESVVEDVDIKRRLFKQMDRVASRSTILASSTSEIQPSLFTERLSGRERCLVAHPINPPHLIPLVEICRSPWTTDAATDRTVTFMRSVGCDPVVLRHEVPGFILNRLQMALIREALNLVDTGVCAAVDIDQVVTRGLGRRWAVLGPFEAGHLNSHAGYRDYMTKFGSSMRSLFETLSIDNEIKADLIERIDAELTATVPLDRIGAHQMQRDIRLAGLRSHLDAARSGN